MKDNYIAAPEPDVRSTDREWDRGSQVQQTLQRREETTHRGDHEETQVSNEGRQVRGHLKTQMFIVGFLVFSILSVSLLMINDLRIRDFTFLKVPHI